MELDFDRKLILEDGGEYYGYGFGAKCGAVTELVFNTSPVGYQEIVSDPSYTYQTVVMAYPIIGSYGVAPEDFETATPTIGGLVVRDYNDAPSNFRSVKTLDALMREYGVPGISGADTRKLIRSIRDVGSRAALMTDAATPLSEGLSLLRAHVPPRDAVARVSRKSAAVYPVENARFHVAAVDCGMKQNIVRRLNELGCTVTALPFTVTAEEVDSLRPDGLLISNGPGDPADVQPVIELVRSLRGRYPMFGVCLGHQMIALAYGAETYKLKFGHRGGNHPVRELSSGKIEITSQNHSYAVRLESLEKTPLRATHINLLDGTAEGLEYEADWVFSVQYHPESAPGPQDGAYLFERFIAMMEARKNA